ncbi:MAG: hypothetical protein ABIZ91_09735 [Gemmatimonadaceae bacterium]
MHDRLGALVAGFNPVTLIVAAVFCCIMGVLIIAFPQIVVWTIGIGIILVGVALLATAFLRDQR